MKPELELMDQEVLDFRIEDLLPIGMTLAVLGIGLAFTLQVMGDIKSDMTADTAEYNATADAIEGVSKIPAKLPIIATVIVASIIIGILVTYLWIRR